MEFHNFPKRQKGKCPYWLIEPSLSWFSQEPYARLLLPLLFKLKNLLQRISLAGNSQVSACILIPSQPTAWMDTVLFPCSVQSLLTPPGFSPTVNGKTGCTRTQNQQNVLAFSPVREQTSPRVIDSVSPKHQPLAKGFASKQCLSSMLMFQERHRHPILPVWAISNLQQPTSASPTLTARCRDLQGVSLTLWYLRVNPGIFSDSSFHNRGQRSNNPENLGKPV